MGVIAKYKFNNTLEANLLPEFNNEFTSDLYTITDEVNGEVTIRTIESDSLPTLMRFGRMWVNGESNTDNRTDSLLEVLDMNTSGLTSCHSMFRYCKNLTSITCEWDTGNVTSMNYMFYCCNKLTSLNVSNFNTSNVTTMQNMFNSCYKLTSLDVGSWNTYNVTTMYCMFANCTNLTSLDVSNWNTSSVTNMASMFYCCDNLTLLDVSNWNTSNVTNMQNMFYCCINLTSLDVSNFNTSKVTNMQGMFGRCYKVSELDVSNWETSNVTDMRSTFQDCNNLTTLDVSNWDTSKVTIMASMFYACNSLTTLDVSNFDTSKVTNMSGMFRNCKNLTTLDVSNFNTSKVQDMYAMFNSCSSLTSLNVSNWDTSGLISAPEVFYNCSKLTSLNLSKWDTSNVVGMGYMFGNCYSLTTLDVSNWDTNKVTTMTDMFAGIKNLKYFKCNNINTLNTLNTLLPTKSSTSQGTIICKSDITNLDTTSLQSKNWNILDEPTLIAKYVFDKSIYNSCIPEFNTEFEGYFIEDEVEEGSNEVTRTIESCGMLSTLMRFGQEWVIHEVASNKSLSLLEVLNINTEQLTTAKDMFRNCANVKNICIHISSKVDSIYGIFENCNKLEKVDVSEWNTSRVTNMYCVFGSCSKLKKVDVSKWDTSQVTNMSYLFLNCYSLTSINVSNFNTSKVTTMYGIFQNCAKLTSLDVSNWDISNVTETANMFYNTPLLTDIGVLYMDKSSLQKLVDAMPTDSNKTLWYKDVNIDGITHGDNITLKKYMEGNVEIVLNSPLLEGDTIEVKDGKLCHYHKMGIVVLDGSEKSWKLDMSSSTDNTLRFYMNNIGQKDGRAVIICPTFNFKKTYTLATNDTEGIFGSQNGSSLFIDISKSKLSEVSVNGFKQWLQANPTTVVYELASPYYEDITNLQSAPTLKTYLECSMEIDTDLPIDTNVTYRTNLSSVYVMERELDELDNGTDLGDILEGEVNE